MTRPLVVIESPYAGDVTAHVEYARRCMVDALERGDIPFASHLLYTQVLDDQLEEHRALGMACGFAWAEHADERAFYVDLGWSKGMQRGLEVAVRRKQKVSIRTVGTAPMHAGHHIRESIDSIYIGLSEDAANALVDHKLGPLRSLGGHSSQAIQAIANMCQERSR